MNNDARPHWSFWLISVVVTAWNAMGAMNYFMQMNSDMLADYPDAARAIVLGRPAWATAGFALSVFGGTVGGLLLLLRRSSASYVFIASLVGTLITMIHTLRVANSTDSFETTQTVMYVAMPIIAGVLFIAYARIAQKNDWLS